MDTCVPEEESTQSEADDRSPEKVKKKTKRPSSAPSKAKPSLNSTFSKLSAFEADDEVTEDKTVWDHENLSWLKTENIKDKNNNKPRKGFSIFCTYQYRLSS